MSLKNRKDGQLSQLSNLEEHLSTSQEQLCCVQEKINALKIAIQWATEVRQSPFLKQNYALDKAENVIL